MPGWRRCSFRPSLKADQEALPPDPASKNPGSGGRGPGGVQGRSPRSPKASFVCDTNAQKVCLIARG